MRLVCVCGCSRIYNAIGVIVFVIVARSAVASRAAASGDFGSRMAQKSSVAVDAEAVVVLRTHTSRMGTDPAITSWMSRACMSRNSDAVVD